MLVVIICKQIYWGIEQLAVHWTLDPDVVGSIPTSPSNVMTNKKPKRTPRNPYAIPAGRKKAGIIKKKDKRKKKWSSDDDT